MTHIISRAPVRISLFGGGTDYPSYYIHYPGAVLGTTIDKFTHVSINKLSPYFDHKIRIGYSKTELVTSPNEIIHPSIRECLKYKKIDDHLDIHIFSDLPARTGLGSSSSFTVSFLNALHALMGKRISKQQLASEACFVEQKLIQENVGSQDQFHASFGGLNLMEFSEKGTSVRPVVTSKDTLADFESHLLLFFTGITRYASEVVSEQIKRTEEREIEKELKEIYAFVFAAEEIFGSKNESNPIKRIGKMLTESWKLKRKLSSKITNDQIDQAFEEALRRGAYGGKLCGAGGGGFLLFLAPPSVHASIEEGLKGMLKVPIHLEYEGAKIIYYRG